MLVPGVAGRFLAGLKLDGSLYVVNARFDVAPPPILGGPIMSIDHDVVQVPAD